MKFLLFCSLLGAALPLASLSAQNIVTNGDFETGTGTAFNVTPPWYNRGVGLNQTSAARSNNNNLGASTFNAVINDRYDTVTPAFGTVAHSQNTGYTIQSGDYFAVSYDWRDAADWQQARDFVRVVLFATTNNALGGPIAWSVTLDSPLSTLVTTWESVSTQTTVVNEAAVGRPLFINFFGVDNGGLSATTGFARVDNVTVMPIPEPQTTALAIGLATLGFVFLRRRRR